MAFLYAIVVYMEAAAAAANATIQRALRLLEGQRRASRAYYQRHKQEIKERSTAYWNFQKDAINARRRERYELSQQAKPEINTAAPIRNDGGNQQLRG